MAQDCTYVYEHHDPRSGRVMFVGRATGETAWLAVEAALQAREPVRAGHRGLYWFLRDLIQAGYGPEVLAPTIVHCGRDAAQEYADRVAAYGAENLLNDRRDTAVSGAEPRPNTGVCQPGFPCVHQFERVRRLERVSRQVGVYGVFISGRFEGKARSGFWRSDPIIHDQALLNEIRRAAAQAEPDGWTDGSDAFCLAYAVRALVAHLNEPALALAARTAAVIRSILRRDFFIVEADPDGNIVAFHDQPIRPDQFAEAKAVMAQIGGDLRAARVAEHPAIWARVDAGGYLDGSIAVPDPDAPPLPPANHVPFQPRNIAASMPPPTPVAMKPAALDPALEAAFARFQSILAGETPPPVIPDPAPLTHDDPGLIAALTRIESGMGLEPRLAEDARPPVSPEQWAALARIEPPDTAR